MSLGVALYIDGLLSTDTCGTSTAIMLTGHVMPSQAPFSIELKPQLIPSQAPFSIELKPC